jgi:hypothetical protein
VPRRVGFGGVPQRQNVRCDTLAEPVKIGLDRGQHRVRQSTTQVRPQELVGVVLVVEARAVLIELAHLSIR